MPTSVKTVADILKAGADYLSGKNVDEPRLACELLISRLLHCKRLELYLRFDTALSEKQLAAMRRGIRRVGDGEPVQYVLGNTEFMGAVFKVDKRALIPRPETEVLVDHVLRNDSFRNMEKPVILDVGTGSGCIIISLAVACPLSICIGLDISPDAIQLAKENARTLGVEDRITFAAEDMSESMDPEIVDVLVTNPPYIPTAEYERLPAHIRDHEPRVALDGGPSGMSVIEALVQDAVIVLKPGGMMFMEIDERQGAPVSALMKSAGFENISVIRDLANRDRVLSATLAG